MQKIFNKDGFNWWIGVVEDRQDPEKLGRCKVRIFGYHTNNKELLRTKDLPWCIPIQPITSAAVSGIGSSPLGPVQGTWVIGFFLDGEDCQQPAMFGTISTKAAKTSFFTQATRENTNNPYYEGVIKDSQGNPVTDSQGLPIKSGTPSIPGWYLGKTSERYESGGRGPGVINDYNGASEGDYGGAQYGIYQLASYLPSQMKSGKARQSAKNSPVIQFISVSKFKVLFEGLTPATPEFDSKWKEIASEYPILFRDDQHEYIQKTHYNVMISNLQSLGLNLTKYGPGVQDLVWSTAVQLGPHFTSVFTEPLQNKSELTDRDIINLVCDYKIANVNTLFMSSSSSIQNGVRARYQSEKIDLLSLVQS